MYFKVQCAEHPTAGVLVQVLFYPKSETAKPEFNWT